MAPMVCVDGMRHRWVVLGQESCLFMFIPVSHGRIYDRSCRVASRRPLKIKCGWRSLRVVSHFGLVYELPVAVPHPLWNSGVSAAGSHKFRRHSKPLL